MDKDVAYQRFIAENKIETISKESMDDIYRFDDKLNKQQLDNPMQKWKKDPNYFKKVKISSVALIKMVMHARSGGNIEVMGLMQGKIIDDTMWVMDAFALPVEGTETRVNAQAEAYEYMVNYNDTIKQVGRYENVLGWYHSHPGYGCWLSGIDVSTQGLNQTYQDPFVAVVIDPNRTISAGKVEIGAFRTYPENYVPENVSKSEYQTIPLDKIEDFGVHANKYYQLEISYFKSSLDVELLELLWNKYWVNTLSSSPLITNKEYTISQIKDLSQKVDHLYTSNQSTAASNGSSSYLRSIPADRFKIAEGETKPVAGMLGKVTQDSIKISCDCQHGLISQVLKNALFNRQ